MAASHPAKTASLANRTTTQTTRDEAQFEDPSSTSVAVTKSKPKKQGIKSAPLDWDRTTEADPRDPRFSGPPCRGERKPAGMYKGSPSGSNQYGKWVVCEVCNLRLSYTPRAGCHGLTRSPGALPSDVKTALNEELPNLESLKDKDIGWAAAEKSAEANLQRIRQSRMAHQASSRGAAPKGKGTSKSQKGYSPATTVPVTTAGSELDPSPTSTLGSAVLIDHEPNDPEELKSTPGRKATRKNEEAAEDLEYAQRRRDQQ